jgi:hypothetical protein
MMLVMLVMNTVERWLTSPGRSPLRLVAGGVAGEAAVDAGEDGPPALAGPPPPAAPEMAAPATALPDGSTRTAIVEHLPALARHMAHPAGRASAADARG